MASNIYTQHYTNGSSDLRRRIRRQGRTPQPKELKMVRINVTMSPAAVLIIQKKAKLLNMSFSAYLELSGILYTPELLKQ